MTIPDPTTKRTRAGNITMARRLLPPNDYLGWTPYAWLVYLPIFLVEPFLRARLGAMTPAYALLTLFGVIVFLTAYFRGFWVGGRELLMIVAVQTLLGVAFAPFNTGSSVFFIYAASFAGSHERTRTAISAILTVALTGLLVSWFTTAPLHFWIPAAGFPLLIGFVNLQEAQVRRSNSKLRLAQEQIEHLAAVAERERIARDLHDLLGHTLSLIVLKSELASKLATRDPVRAAEEIRDIEQVSRKALREVREAIRGYRPSLAEEVEQSRSLLGAAGIRVEMEIETVEVQRPAEEALALALREAVTNVVRHSKATVCRIRLRAEPDVCVLLIEDDGSLVPAPEGGGIRGMRERVEALGGSVRRGRGTAGRGLRLEVRVPLGYTAPATPPAPILPLRRAASA